MHDKIDGLETRDAAQAVRPRIAVVSTTIPPGASGQARVLGHLLGFPPAENCLLLADQSPFPGGAVPDAMAANYAILKSRRAYLTGDGWLPRRMPRLNALAGMLGSIFHRAREIDRHVRSFGASALVVCTASPFDLPAGTLVALRRRLRLVTYLFDDPVYQWPSGPLRTFARLWEPIWSRVAAAVIVPNEALAEEYRRRRARAPIVVRNPVPPQAFSPPNAGWPPSPGPYTIAYTGSVYHAQADAFLNLLAALRQVEGWSLHIYTSQNEADLGALGISGPNVVRHDHVDQSESYLVQRSADILFLPLAFHSTIQETLRTSAPMKMGEYLASGRPILVHAPSDTFVAQHLAQAEAAIVVTHCDSGALAAALRDVPSNSPLRQRVCANAARLAQDYGVARAREVFWQAIGPVADERRRGGGPSSG